MGLMHHSYYGRLIGLKPIRSLADDLFLEYKKNMLEELKEMESRLKRHITECKREIVKAICPGEIKSTKEKEVTDGLVPSKKSKPRGVYGRV